MFDTVKTKGCFLALGTFDGLHLGHKAVLKAGESENRYALLFNEHPQKVLKGASPTSLITKETENKLLLQWGITPIYIDFSDISDLSPEAFFEEIIVKKINPREISVGFNYRFGKNAEGDAELLSSLCKSFGITLFKAKAEMYENEPISSTRIRAAIKSGDIEKANAMLGRSFCYDFEVVHGDERGRTIGSPTINQFFDDNFTIPAFGVYASKTEIDGKIYPSVTNIGIRPTVGSSKERSETNIIGFEGDLYGRRITVMPQKKLRDEKKFSSLEGLRAQIDFDRERTLKMK